MRPSQLATFMMAWESRRFSVICSPELLEEYEHVLAYPNIAIRISPELLRAFQNQLKRDIELIELPTITPICRDPDDDKVIATAIFGAVDYLITEDSDITEAPEIVKILNDSGITIASTDEIIRLLDTHNSRSYPEIRSGPNEF